MKSATVLLTLCWVAVAFATHGLDLSQLASSSTYSCAKNNGYSFAIPRGYRSSGSVDPNVVQNIKNARAGGMSYVDVYMFPCYSCGNPEGQMDALVNAIKGQNYGMIWLDIEVYQWSSSLSNNQNFITRLIQEGKKKGQHLGIYSSYYNWQSIVGLNWCYPEQQGLVLWYAHYDNNPSFSDYTEFGCWSKPNIKQYAGDKYVCSFDWDLNWYP